MTEALPDQGIQTVGRFFGRLRRDLNDLTPLVEMIEHYETELVAVHQLLKVDGIRLVRVGRELPGWHSYRAAQLDEIESVIKLIEVKIEVETQTHRKKYLEGYAKTLNASTAEKYAEAENSVVDLVLLRIELEHLRGRFAAGVKGMENLRYWLKTQADLGMKQMEDMIV